MSILPPSNRASSVASVLCFFSGGCFGAICYKRGEYSRHERKGWVATRTKREKDKKADGEEEEKEKGGGGGEDMREDGVQR